MNRAELEAFAKETAKHIKTVKDLSDFRQVSIHIEATGTRKYKGDSRVFRKSFTNYLTIYLSFSLVDTGIQDKLIVPAQLTSRFNKL